MSSDNSSESFCRNESAFFPPCHKHLLSPLLCVRPQAGDLEEEEGGRPRRIGEGPTLQQASGGRAEEGSD